MTTTAPARIALVMSASASSGRMSPDAAYTTARGLAASTASMSSVAATPEFVAEPGEVARVAADLLGVVDEHGRQFQRRMGLDGTNGGTADVARYPTPPWRSCVEHN